MKEKRWKLVDVELVWYEGMLGIWCIGCGRFVPLTDVDTPCDFCGYLYRIRITSKEV